MSKEEELSSPSSERAGESSVDDVGVEDPVKGVALWVGELGKDW